jgi:hypothetical protein
MQFAGGKARIIRHIAPIIARYARDMEAYAEPFVGGGNALVGIVPLLPAGIEIIAGDSNASLVALYRDYARERFTPPTSITKEEYLAIKAAAGPSALKGFAGTACSFAGKWLDSYAVDGRGQDFIGAGTRWLEKHKATLRRVYCWFDVPYSEIGARVEPGRVLWYCDPPYADTTQGYESRSFDSQAFWRWAAARQAAGDTVLVSEYTAPDDWVPVWSGETKTSLHHMHANAPRVEHLWRHKRQEAL